MMLKERRAWQVLLGPRGVKGEVGTSGKDAEHRNWKQCAWKSYDGHDIGLVKVSSH